MSDEVWLTYVQLGKALGITTIAARSLAKRHKWPRRIPNAPGSAALVLVPPDRLRSGIDLLIDPPGDLPTDHPVTTLDPGSRGDRSKVDQESDPAIDRQTDPGSDQEVDPWTGIPVMFATMQKIVELLHTELSAAQDRAIQASQRAEMAEHRVDDLQREIQQLTGLMADQQTAHQHVVEVLVAQLPTRRHRWWPWRRSRSS